MRLTSELLTALERDGWTVNRHKGEGTHLAWFQEVWEIESRWSPHGFKLFLTFCMMEQVSPNPFWAIGTSFRFPGNATEASGEPMLVMSPNWSEELPQFVAQLNSHRDAFSQRNL